MARRLWAESGTARLTSTWPDLRERPRIGSRPIVVTGATPWTFPDVWEQVAAAFPDAPAAIHGDRRISWAEFDRRAAALAATLLAHGWRPAPRWRSTCRTGPSTWSRSMAL